MSHDERGCLVREHLQHCGWWERVDILGTLPAGYYLPEGTFKAVTAEYTTTCGLRTDGVIICWGRDGPLNINTTANP